MSKSPIPMNDLKRSWIATSSIVKDEISAVLSSGHFVLGSRHDAFEHELARFLGGEVQAVGVASGTDALRIALASVGLGSGDRVLMPANAGGYSALAAAQLGCQLVYADCDPDSLLVTPTTVASALDEDISAVVVTHLYGNSVDVAGIKKLCEPLGIPIIEDCAQGIGGTLSGEERCSVGTIGDVACFSFYPTKNLGAAGDGGAVVSRRVDVLQAARALRQYGWTSRYNIAHSGGLNSRLDELQAAVLRIGLEFVNDLNDRRRQIVERYRKAVVGGGLRLVTGAGVPTTGHLAVFQAPMASKRVGARAALLEMGISSDVHYPIPDHQQSGLPRPARETDLNVAESACQTVFSVPCFPDLTDDEVGRVAKGLALVTDRMSRL